jgi:hypothetical protein
MGFFSDLFKDEQRTSVGTSVARVIQDAVLPNSIRTGVIKSIFESGSIPEYAMEEMIGSIGMKAERLYEYARTHYTHGLPSGQFKSATAGLPEATAILSTLEGAVVTPIYCHYGLPNALHIGWLKLIAEHGYNTTTNQLAGLTASVGVPVYLDDIEIVVPELQFASYSAGALDQWGTPATAGYTPLRRSQGPLGEMRSHTPVRLDPVAVETYIRVTYIWANPLLPNDPSAVLTGTLNINLSGYSTNLDYFQAKYTVGGVTKYWVYQDSAGTYPTLDGVFSTTPNTHGTFFPFTYFRYNQVSQNTNVTSEAYLTSKKMVNYLGMSYDSVADAVNANPGIADVEQAMLIMAVPANTSNELERRYLFAFFDNLYYAGDLQLTSVAQASIASTLAGNNPSTSSALTIQDARFTMVLSNGGIYKKRKRGTVAPVGQHTSGISAYNGAVVVVSNDTGTYNVPTQVSYHYYCKQLTPTLYDEIWVVNPMMQYYIYEGRFSTADEGDPTLLIPLDRSITSTFSVQDRETLYARSLHYVFNSRVTVSIKWYQQAWFGTLMQIVAVVVIVVSWGSATGPMAALISAIAAGSAVLITAAVLAILQQLLIGMLLAYAFKLFAKAVGVEIAIAVAVIAAAMGMYEAVDAGGVAGSPWAMKLLQVSSGLSTAVQAEVKDMYGDLLEEYQSFNIFKDESTKALEAANKLLEHNNWLSPFVIFGEKPDDYYNRTIHAGNVGVLGIGAISSYVDTALTLPKLDESIEG